MFSFKTIMECLDLEPNCGEPVLINALLYAFCWSFGGTIQVCDVIGVEQVKFVTSLGKYFDSKALKRFSKQLSLITHIPFLNVHIGDPRFLF